jgi:hypothetical protein
MEVIAASQNKSGAALRSHRFHSKSDCIRQASTKRYDRHSVVLHDQYYRGMDKTQNN